MNDPPPVIRHRSRSIPRMQRRVIVGVGFALATLTTNVFAQSTSQGYIVKVPTRLTVTPPAEVSITHDLSDEAQAFPIQVWSLAGNAIGGMAVNFNVDQPFTHSTEIDNKVDAAIEISLRSSDGPGVWHVTTANDQTDEGQGKATATVGVSSDGVGSAEVGLLVRFAASDEASLAQGDYATTVICTVTAP